MTRPKKPRAPRISVTARFGLSPHAGWVGIPVALRRLLRDRQVVASHRLVMFEIIDHWRPDQGPVVPCSLGTLAKVTGLSRTTIAEALRGLIEKGLLHYLPEQGRRGNLDLTPTLEQLSGRPNSTVRPTEQHCTVDRTALFGQPNRTVNLASLAVAPKTSREQEESGAVHADAHTAPTAPPPDPGAPQTSPARAAARQSIRDTLGIDNRPPAAPHPRALPGESFAQTQARLLSEIQDLEHKRLSSGQ